jgi:hypothetical protein
MMKKMLQVSAIFLIPLMWVSESVATPPIIDTFYVGDDIEVIQCGDYNVRASGTYRITEKVWFDDFGEPVRVRVKIQVIGSEYYNDTNEDISISQGMKGAGENMIIEVDLLTGEEHWSGNLFRLTIPGIGRVIWDVGTWKLDGEGNLIFFAGKGWVFAEGETGPALCEALAS